MILLDANGIPEERILLMNPQRADKAIQSVHCFPSVIPWVPDRIDQFSIIMLLFMNALELLVAFVQAYVFTMLSAVFIGLAHKEHHAE